MVKCHLEGIADIGMVEVDAALTATTCKTILVTSDSLSRKGIMSELILMWQNAELLADSGGR